MKKDKVIDVISWSLLGITMILLKLASRYVENIVFGRNFVWNYFLIGLAISSMWIYVLYKSYPAYFEGGEKRAGAVLSQFFSIIILTIFLSAYYTFATGKENIYHKLAIVAGTGSNIKSGTDYLHLRIDGREERFNPNWKEFKALSEGDTVILTIGKGKTNYEFIYGFRKK